MAFVKGLKTEEEQVATILTCPRLMDGGKVGKVCVRVKDLKGLKAGIEYAVADSKLMPIDEIQTPQEVAFETVKVVRFDGEDELQYEISHYELTADVPTDTVGYIIRL